MEIVSALLGGAQLAAGLIGGRKAKKEARKARREQEARIAEVSRSYLDLAQKYTPTGEYGKSMFETLATQKQLDIGATTQQFLRAGVGGTSFADISAQYERRTGRTQRRTLEDFLQDRYTGLMRERTQFLAGAPTIQGPSYSDVASAYAGAGEGIGTLIEAFGKKKEIPATYKPSVWPVH